MNLIIQAIQQLLKNAVSQIDLPLSDIKKIYYGDPIIIPQSSLPCITIQPTSTNYIQRWSQYDMKQHNIDIKLIYNAKSYFAETIDSEKVNAVEDSILKIENTLNFSTNNYTICGTIEKNNTLSLNWMATCQLAKVDKITYWLNEARGFPTYEVTTSIIANVVGNR